MERTPANHILSEYFTFFKRTYSLFYIHHHPSPFVFFTGKGIRFSTSAVLTRHFASLRLATMSFSSRRSRSNYDWMATSRIIFVKLTRLFRWRDHGQIRPHWIFLVSPTQEFDIAVIAKQEMRYCNWNFEKVTLCFWKRNMKPIRKRVARRVIYRKMSVGAVDVFLTKGFPFLHNSNRLNLNLHYFVMKLAHTFFIFILFAFFQPTITKRGLFSTVKICWRVCCKSYLLLF